MHSFTTPAVDAKEVTFTIWNDTHKTVEMLTKLHGAHTKLPTDFLV